MPQNANVRPAHPRHDAIISEIRAIVPRVKTKGFYRALCGAIRWVYVNTNDPKHKPGIECDDDCLEDCDGGPNWRYVVDEFGEGYRNGRNFVRPDAFTVRLSKPLLPTAGHVSEFTIVDVFEAINTNAISKRKMEVYADLWSEGESAGWWWMRLYSKRLGEPLIEVDLPSWAYGVRDYRTRVASSEMVKEHPCA